MWCVSNVIYSNSLLEVAKCQILPGSNQWRGDSGQLGRGETPTLYLNTVHRVNILSASSRLRVWKHGQIHTAAAGPDTTLRKSSLSFISIFCGDPQQEQWFVLFCRISSCTCCCSSTNQHANTEIKHAVVWIYWTSTSLIHTKQWINQMRQTDSSQTLHLRFLNVYFGHCCHNFIPWMRF